MFIRKLSTLFLVIIFSSSAFGAEKNSTKNPKIEVWDSTEGLKRLEHSQSKNDFYQLINFYQPQENPVYCSIATSVMILNALNYGNIPSQKELELTRPEAAGGGVALYPTYSQKTFLNEKTDKIKKRAIIDFKEPAVIGGKELYDAGLSLADLSKILSGPYKLKTKIIYADSDDEEYVEEFRNVVKRILAEKKSFIIVNFDGQILGQKTKGHISPLAAYDEESDSVLVLDVALFKNKWYFVKIEDLFQAMHSKDKENYRGYLIVKR